MNIETRDNTFDIICKISDQNVDPIIKNRLHAMVGRPNEDIKDELLGLIDDIVFSSLTSDFVIQCLSTVWESIGGSKKELAERNQQLQDSEKKEEFQKRFKWQACHM